MVGEGIDVEGGEGRLEIWPVATGHIDTSHRDG